MAAELVNSGIMKQDTGRQLEECASSRPVRRLSAMRKHVRGLSVSVSVAHPERSVANLAAS